MNRLVPILFFAIAGFLLMFTGFGSRIQQTNAKYKLPERGLCAHRGAMATHPENTLAAFREAIIHLNHAYGTNLLKLEKMF
jgi:glycerophosphoryl diester phosphodiesterase